MKTLLMVLALSGCATWAPGETYRLNPATAETCEAQGGCFVATKAWLQEDCGEAEEILDTYCEVPLSQNQRDALISFIFNVGEVHFRDSTLLVRLNRLDYAGAADQLLRWNRAGGRILRGLTRRRTSERSLFLA